MKTDILRVYIIVKHNKNVAFIGILFILCKTLNMKKSG